MLTIDENLAVRHGGNTLLGLTIPLCVVLEARQ